MLNNFSQRLYLLPLFSMKTKKILIFFLIFRIEGQVLFSQTFANNVQYTIWFVSPLALVVIYFQPRRTQAKGEKTNFVKALLPTVAWFQIYRSLQSRTCTLICLKNTHILYQNSLIFKTLLHNFSQKLYLLSFFLRKHEIKPQLSPHFQNWKTSTFFANVRKQCAIYHSICEPFGSACDVLSAQAKPGERRKCDFL